MLNGPCLPKPAQKAFLLFILALCSFPLWAEDGIVHVRGVQKQPLFLVQGEGSIIRFDEAAESVFIADPSVVDIRMVAPRTAYLLPKKTGHTNLVAMNSRGGLLASVPLLVESVAEQALRSGSVSYMTSQAASSQINIRVRFVEIQREKLLKYGINWQGLLDGGEFSFSMLPDAVGTESASVFSGIADLGKMSLQGTLEALEQRGVLEVLAEPNITTMSGESASFLAGGEVPVPVPVSDNAVGIQYKSFGVSLDFTPVLLPGRKISMKVRPEVSSISETASFGSDDYQVPVVQVRRADTRVEVGSGQTFAIAGLFQKTDRRNYSRVPLLGSLPVLGQLFKSKRFQNNETELVILITPYLVKPTSGPMASPDDPAPEGAAPRHPDSMTPATEFGFYVQ